MNKRITSIVLSLVMLFTMLATAVPVLAATPVALKVTADTTSAHPGDTINYKVFVGAVTNMGGLEFRLNIPSGLTIVDDSISIPTGLETTIDSDGAIVVPKSGNGYKWSYSAQMTGYTGSSDLVILNFACTVDDGASGDKIVTINVDTFFDNDPPYPELDYTVTPATVNVTAAPVAVTGVTIDETLSVNIGQTKTPSYTVAPAEATNKTVSFTSDNPAVATVNATTGAVTGVKKGTATITVKTADGNFTDTCTVTVTCAHSSLQPVAEKASNCTDKGWDAYKKCNLCGKLFDVNGNLISEIPYRTLNNDHDFNTSEWGYKEADGHAHVCSRNAAHHDTVVPHTAGPAATETTPQTCTECGFVMQPATGHVHADHLTKVDKKDATCTADGNKEYYRCTCDKLFEDAAAATEITDHSSVVLPKTGHSYTVQKSDEAHKRSTAADCREFDTYWYTCANDETHSAKDDAAAADKFYNGEQGAHVYGNEWVDRGEAGHAHKCQYHDAYDEVLPHTPDHEGGATYDYAVKCTECGRVLEPQREHGSIRIEVPFKLTVKKTGEMAPGQETFKFAVEKFGAPTTYTVVQDTVETNGEKTYEGKFIFTIRDDEAGNLSEGFVIRQVKGNAAGWTYDETMFYAVPLFVDSYESVGGWSFFKFDQNNGLDHNNPLREIGFTNSFNAKMPVTPPAPETPKTGDGSMMGLSIALVIVSGAALMGTALYSRRKSR